MGIARRLTSQGVASTNFQFTILIGAGGTFTLPLGTGDYNGLNPNFIVYWGDAGSNTITSSSDLGRIHTYTSAGTYTISISGFCPVFIVNNTPAIRALIKTIVQWGSVGFRQINFYGCTSLTTLPTDYTGLQDVELFASFMRSTGLTSIPAGIFDYAYNAQNFGNAFSFTNITSIPSGLFTNNIQATVFESAFNNCLQLATCPSNLFDTNINAVNFSATFRLCRLLTSPLQFTYNTQVTTFNNVYYMSSTSNSMSGTAPDLWNRVPVTYGVGAFHNCIGLSNYTSIPSYFK